MRQSQILHIHTANISEKSKEHKSDKTLHSFLTCATLVVGAGVVGAIVVGAIVVGAIVAGATVV